MSRPTTLPWNGRDFYADPFRTEPFFLPAGSTSWGFDYSELEWRTAAHVYGVSAEALTRRELRVLQDALWSESRAHIEVLFDRLGGGYFLASNRTAGP